MSRAARIGFALAALAGVSLFAKLATGSMHAVTDKRDGGEQAAARSEHTHGCDSDALRRVRACAPVDGEGRYRASVLVLAHTRSCRVASGSIRRGAAQRPIAVLVTWAGLLGADRLMRSHRFTTASARSEACERGGGSAVPCHPEPVLLRANEPVVFTFLSPGYWARVRHDAASGECCTGAQTRLWLRADLVALPNTLPPRHFGYAFSGTDRVDGRHLYFVWPGRAGGNPTLSETLRP